MFNFSCRALAVLLFVSVAHGQTTKVVVIPLGGDDGGDDISECVVDSCGAGIAALTCPSGAVEIPCLIEDKTVFITSTTHNGNLGGLEGADAICQGLATNQGMDGVFKAWLAGPSEDPDQRFLKSTVPYVLLNGIRIADDWDDLTDGSPLAADICVAEDGSSAICETESQVWTNTVADGRSSNPSNNSHCDDWTVTSTTGIAGRSVFVEGNGPEEWTFAIRPSCSEELHLYCFEQ